MGGRPNNTQNNKNKLQQQNNKNKLTNPGEKNPKQKTTTTKT